MLFKKSILFVLFICSLLGCEKSETVSVLSQIIPEPRAQAVNQGQFILNEKTELIHTDGFEVPSNFLKAFIENGSAIKFNPNTGSNTIVFIQDSTIKNVEGYLLNITSDTIQIKAKTDQGAFYAVQSLRQLLPAEFEKGQTSVKEVAIQCLRVEDQPRFKYRGMHLDVGRHLYSIDFIKKYIDAMAMLKMNTFHWHLTEDQGWRIEIKKYPKLNEIAAYRNETLIGHYSDQPHQFDKKQYGGYYTQDQIKDIVKYAQQRYVTIIPEIEMPGHSQAAIAAYSNLGCTGEQVEVATKWGVFEAVYCTKEETFNFLEDVLDEVLDLFPSTYIHIGGDEAPKTRWKTCDDCQNRMKKEGLEDEHELQNYFISRIERYLNSKGRQIIGWDEILEGGLAPNATVMSWRGTKGAVEAVKAHHNVVMTPTSHCYFDYYQSDNDDEPLAIGGFLSLEKVYSFNPIPEGITSEEAGYILGAQGNIWTEYMPTSRQVEYMMFPRILAMSEVVWSKNETKDYAEFVSRLEAFHKRLDALNINYANHLFEVEGALFSEKDQLSYELKTLIKNRNIRYTLDTTEPTLDSKIYSGLIPINKSTILKAAVFNTEKQMGSTFMQHLNYHKAVGKKITLNVEPHKAYNTGGKNALINSINGSNTRFGDKEWLGFWGDDVEVTIDLGVETKISSISTRFYNANGQWVYAPKEIGLRFNNEKAMSIYKISSSNLIVKTTIDDVDIQKKARYIHLYIKNYGIIPEGKQGAGNKAWTFIDEIIVN